MTRTEPDAASGPDTRLEPMARRLWPRPAPRTLTVLRWSALLTWIVVIVFWVRRDGITYDRNTLLICICTGLMAASIGHRNALLVVRDWLPFALVLLLYDYTRGAALWFGRPTEWHLQINFDRALFFGHEPTVWLQSKLKEPFPPWWEVIVSLVYVSFFFLPYVVAGVLYVRNRVRWKQFILRFVAISFIGLVGFVAFPAAPPWAAALCHSSDVIGGPSDPSCMDQHPGFIQDGGMLGKVTLSHQGAAPWIERISTRGWDKLGVPQARALVDEGQATSNEVAAVPSLHAAISSLITVFFWRRLRKRWRPLLAGYALVMAFTLVYAAEHYVFDILLGWLLTGVVNHLFTRWERRAGRESTKPVGAPDTLEASLPARP